MCWSCINVSLANFSFECGKVIAMAEMPKWPIATSNDCLRRDKLLSAEDTGGSQFDCPMEVSHIVDVINIEYAIMHAF